MEEETPIQCPVQQEPDHQDVIDRKAAWLERMFDRMFIATQKSPTAALLVLSMAINFWMFDIITEINRLRIEDIIQLNEKINIAIAKGVQMELPKQFASYKERQDSSNKKLDSSLTSLNGTVKQYFNKKK